MSVSAFMYIHISHSAILWSPDLAAEVQEFLHYIVLERLLLLFPEAQRCCLKQWQPAYCSESPILLVLLELDSRPQSRSDLELGASSLKWLHELLSV